LKNRIWALLLVLALVLGLSASAFAAAPEGRECSVSLEYQDNEDDSPIVGAKFELYLFALRTDSGYELCGDFTDKPISLEKLDAEAMKALASTLGGIIALEGIKPLAEGVTDEAGKLSFAGLEEGLYMLRGQSHYQNKKTYNVNPSVFGLPAWDPAAGAWIYDLELNPKAEGVPDHEPEYIKREVLKVWRDGEGEQRPNEVKVHLIRDGEVYDSAVLSAANGWSHVWDDLEDTHVWTLTEEVPEGYTVTVTQEGVTFVVTNTAPYTPPPPPPPPPDIPQTGQLWWPVPVLAAAGLMLFAAGFVRSRRKYEE